MKVILSATFAIARLDDEYVGQPLRKDARVQIKPSDLVRNTESVNFLKFYSVRAQISTSHLLLKT